jgi:hypothetical protein
MIGLVKSIRDRYNSFCFPLMGIVAGCGSARLERTVRVGVCPWSSNFLKLEDRTVFEFLRRQKNLVIHRSPL